MSQLDKLSLDQLYERPSITKNVLDRILVKEDFSSISPAYCEKVCKLKCKKPESVSLIHTPVDVIILQDYKSPGDRFKQSWQLEKTYMGIIDTLVNKALGSISKNNLSYRVLNVLKCSAEDEIKTTGSKIKQTSVLKCSPYVLEEIRRSKPKVIISTTTDCTKAVGLTGHSNASNFGETHISPILGLPVILTVHPRVTTMIRQNASGALWGYDFYSAIQQCFENAFRLAAGEFSLKSRDEALVEASKRIHITKTLEEVKMWTDFLMAAPAGTIISWDLETSGLDPWDKDARILTSQVGFTDKKTGEVVSVVVPLWHRENHFYDPNEAWKLHAPLIGHPHSPNKVGHNCKFDIQYTAVTTGVRATNVKFDTMLIEHDKNSGLQGVYGLKVLVWLYLLESGLGGYEDDLGLAEISETENEDGEVDEPSE